MGRVENLLEAEQRKALRRATYRIQIQKKDLPKLLEEMAEIENINRVEAS